MDGVNQPMLTFIESMMEVILKMAVFILYISNLQLLVRLVIGRKIKVNQLI